jgi:hypothetical protein
VVTRRALLAGGAVALLAGCGEDDSLAPAPASVALSGELRAERAFAAALASLEPPNRELGRRLAARADARAARLAAVAPADDAAHGDGSALDLGRAVLVAHVGALPSFAARDQRALTAELLVGAATDVAVLSDALGELPRDPFPGTP